MNRVIDIQKSKQFPVLDFKNAINLFLDTYVDQIPDD
jgi:hypothetical protein